MKKNKEVRINIRLTNEIRNKLHIICKENNTTISKEIRKIIEDLIFKNGRKK